MSQGPLLEPTLEPISLPPPKLGRKQGSGNNLKSLASMAIGDSVVGITPKRMNSIRVSAWKAGYKIKTVMLESGLFAMVLTGKP